MTYASVRVRHYLFQKIIVSDQYSLQYIKGFIVYNEGKLIQYTNIFLLETILFVIVMHKRISCEKQPKILWKVRAYLYHILLFLGMSSTLQAVIHFDKFCHFITANRPSHVFNTRRVSYGSNMIMSNRVIGSTIGYLDMYGVFDQILLYDASYFFLPKEELLCFGISAGKR